MTGDELMDAAILSENRTDLAARMAQLGVAELNYSTESNAAAWVIELTQLERKYGYACVEATIEYYIDRAPESERVPLLGESVYCYLSSLIEWKQFIES